MDPGEAEAGDFVNGPQGLMFGLQPVGEERVAQSQCVGCWQTEGGCSSKSLDLNAGCGTVGADRVFFVLVVRWFGEERVVDRWVLAAAGNQGETASSNHRTRGSQGRGLCWWPKVSCLGLFGLGDERVVPIFLCAGCWLLRGRLLEYPLTWKLDAGLSELTESFCFGCTLVW